MLNSFNSYRYCGAHEKSRFQTRGGFSNKNNPKPYIVFATGAFAWAVAAEAVAIFAILARQQAGMPAVLPLAMRVHCAAAIAGQAAFLLLARVPGPCWAEAAVPAKANRARASKVFFMAEIKKGLKETKG